MKAIVVKRYKAQKAYEHDAIKMAARGYEVTSVTSVQPRPGAGRFLLLGLAAAVFKPKPELVVTYHLKS